MTLQEWNQAHIIFLQGIMSRKVMDASEMNHLYDVAHKLIGKELIPNEEPRRKERQKDLVEFILTIKDKLQKLSPFDNDFLDIVKINDEESERPSNWLILVSQKDCHTEELNKLTIKAMVTFAPFELEYLKIIVKYIMESEAKEISQTHALHKIGEVTTKKLTQTEAEKILQKFNEHQWLRFSPDKPNIRLSTRFIAEMEPFLKKNYKGLIYECKETKCNKLVVQRVKCENCEASYHIYCVSRMQSANLRATGEDCARCVNCREILSKTLYKPKFTVARPTNTRKRQYESETDSDSN